jgi:PAS domain S-box-containing protein
MKKEYNILLVEDNEGDVRIIKEMLKEQSCMIFNITLAGSLNEAIQKLSGFAFDTILLDLGLPDSFGFETFRKLNVLYPRINAIIILTGLDDTEVGLKAVYQGAQDYIIKGKLDSDKLIKSIVYSNERNRLSIELKTQLEARKEAEEELKKSLAFSESLLRTIPFGMDIVDERGTVLFQSDNFRGLFGDDAIGKKCWELYRDDKKQCSDCPLFKGITIGKTETYESHGVLGDRIFEISHTGMMYEGKKAMLEIFQDITERLQFEKALLRSEQELKKAQQITHIGSWYLDVETNQVVWTEELYKMYGFNPTLPPPPYTEHMKLFTPESWEILSSSLANTRDTGVPYELELKTVRKDGSNGWMWVRGEVQTDSEGNTIGLWGAAQNISERKNKEMLLEEALENATESDRLKSAFLANMSHEIRTPMNGILGFAELLKEPHLTVSEQQDFIQTIQISGARMLNTINNIVDVSKLESGLMKVDINETNLNEKIEFTYKFFKPEVETKKLKFVFKNSLSAKEAIINTDNEKVYAILTNLIKNAIKFTYEGSIEFGYEKRGEYLEFFVKDTGIGIPQNQQQIIFERFRQCSEMDNRGYEGSGLGLSICKSYVGMLEGKIWVESKEDRGSTFYFTIPYNPVLEEKQSIENVVFIENKKVQLKKLKILIVEDDEISYSLFTRLVHNFSKEVLHAITGVEAVAACHKNSDIDLVMMDIRMPQMNGLEATQQIRQFNKDVIIIAQTAFGFSGDCEKALEAGCNDYISKPINKTVLFELIKKHCNI